MTSCADCGREFQLHTERQRKNGESPRGWLCPTCRFNAAGAKLIGFVKRPVPGVA